MQKHPFIWVHTAMVLWSNIPNTVTSTIKVTLTDCYEMFYGCRTWSTEELILICNRSGSHLGYFNIISAKEIMLWVRLFTCRFFSLSFYVCDY